MDLDQVVHLDPAHQAIIIHPLDPTHQAHGATLPSNRHPHTARIARAFPDAAVCLPSFQTKDVVGLASKESNGCIIIVHCAERERAGDGTQVVRGTHSNTHAIVRHALGI
jgi:hypothetical protein